MSTATCGDSDCIIGPAVVRGEEMLRDCGISDAEAEEAADLATRLESYDDGTNETALYCCVSTGTCK